MGSKAPKGKRLLTLMIDEYAASSPNKGYACIPCDDEDLSKGFKDVTYKQLAQAIDRAAYWLDDNLGPVGHGSGVDSPLGDLKPPARYKQFPTFCYFGPRDLRYPILALACMKTGRQVLFPSHLASHEAYVFLSKHTDCKAYIYDQEFRGICDGVQKDMPQTSCIGAPPMSEWIDDDGSASKPYPYNKTFEEAKDDPVFVVHTSGTTGMPKPVVYTQYMINLAERNAELPGIVEHESYTGSRFYSSLPVYHIGGLLGPVAFSTFFDLVFVFGPARVSPDARIAEQILRGSGTNCAVFTPMLLQEFARNPSLLSYLSTYRAVLFAGAPLPEWAGTALLDAGVKLVSGIGNTESMRWASLPPTDPIDYNYFNFHPAIGAVLEEYTDLHTSADPVHELIFHRTPTTLAHCNIFHAQPHLSAPTIRTKDLFTPHPDPAKQGLWRYKCRADDLIPLLGEVKVYGGAIEAAVTKCPSVLAALMGGQMRARPFLLLEPRESVTSPEQEQAFIDAAWPAIERENMRHFAMARVLRELVLVAREGKTFVKTPKGSVDRMNTLKKFEAEVDGLYEGRDDRAGRDFDGGDVRY